MKRIMLAGAALVILSGCQTGMLKSEPPPRTLAFGKTVLVDDGSCPSSQVKQITGGDGKMIGRKRECVARPAE